MEGFVGDLLRAHQDENSGGWVYRSLKANSFSGENISYRNFLLVLDGLGDFVEKKVGYQAWSDGFDPGGPRLQLRGRLRASGHRPCSSSIAATMALMLRRSAITSFKTFLNILWLRTLAPCVIRTG